MSKHSKSFRQKHSNNFSVSGCYPDISFHSLWDEAAAHPENNPHSFLLPGRRQKLASWNFHRRGVSDKTEVPADEIGPEGCILNRAGQESPKFLCLSLTASTDFTLS